MCLRKQQKTNTTRTLEQLIIYWFMEVIQRNYVENVVQVNSLAFHWQCESATSKQRYYILK